MKSIEVNEKNIKTILSGGGIVVLDFWAEWCGPCKVLTPIIDELANNNDKISVGKINVDESGVIAAAYGIRKIPTIIFFKDGIEVNKISGVQPLKTIQGIVDNLWVD
jgi:thioredoxin 1